MVVENIPSEMKAVRVVEFNKPYSIDQVPVPSASNLPPYALLLKTAVASYCHTDSMVSSGIFPTTLPLVASHEGTGTVVAVGSDVKDYKVGDRVMAGITFNRCGECAECHSENPQYCRKQDGNIGVMNKDGAFADYFVADARNSVKLPDGVKFSNAAPLACAGITIWGGIVKAGLKEGEWLGICGAGGGLGHLGIKFAKALGLRVVAIDARDEGLELSKECGADVVIDARKGDDEVRKAIDEATGGLGGVPVCINVSDAKSAATTAAAACRTHGRVIQIAQPPQVIVPFQEIVFRDIKIEGSLTTGPREMRKMIDLVNDKQIQVEVNVYQGLDSLPEIVERVHSGKIKGKAVVVVDEKAVYL